MIDEQLFKYLKIVFLQRELVISYTKYTTHNFSYSALI